MRSTFKMSKKSIGFHFQVEENMSKYSSYILDLYFEFLVWSTIVLVVGYWLMNHVIASSWDRNNFHYELSKFTFFTQNGQVWKKKSSFWVKINVILDIYSALKRFIFVLAWGKTHEPTAKNWHRCRHPRGENRK